MDSSTAYGIFATICILVIWLVSLSREVGDLRKEIEELRDNNDK